MSTLPTPATPPSHNSLSNAHVDLMTELIAIMYQTLQQNATMMAHMQIQPSHPSAPQPPTDPQYKPQCPPFPKWYGAPLTNPIFPAQVVTYKAEAFYSCVHIRMQTTQASKNLSVAISADMLALLPQSVSSMFLNDTSFASYRIAMISHLLTHLNPSSSENILLAISYLTRLEMVLGELSINYMSCVRSIS